MCCALQCAKAIKWYMRKCYGAFLGKPNLGKMMQIPASFIFRVMVKLLDTLCPSMCCFILI